MNLFIKIVAPIIMIAAGTAVAVILDMNKPSVLAPMRPASI